MAELFVCLWDKRRSDSAEQSSYNWRNGFVVTIKDDGSPWGRMEDPRVWIAQGNDLADWQPLGRFAIVLAPGVAADYPQAKEVDFRPSLFSEKEFIASDEEDQRVKWTRRRRWKMDTPPELATDGIGTFTPTWTRLW